MNVAVVIPARLSSSRLPNKALLPYAGLPLPQLLARRLSNSKYNLDIVVTPSDNPNDEPLRYESFEAGLDVMRGPEGQCLTQVVNAARAVGADVIVRATCDNPMLDARAVDVGLDFVRQTEADAACNLYADDNITPETATERNDPWGYYVDIVRTRVLTEVLANDPSEDDQEHVTYGLKKRGRCKRFDVLPRDVSQLNWTVDTPGDYSKMSKLFFDCGPDVTAEEAIRWELQDHRSRRCLK